MKHYVSTATAASALLWFLIIISPACAQSSIPPNPQIEIQYVKPTNPSLTPVYQRLEGRKVLETLQQFLAPLKLPASHKLTVKFNQCGGPTATYKQGEPVTICYEYAAQVEQLAPKSSVTLVQGSVLPDAAIVGPVVQEVLHETAIGVFDALDLPVWGHIDDAADRVSAFILLQFGPDIAWNTVVGTAWFLSGNATAAPDFASIGGVVAQRYYTMLCIAYGGEARGAKVVANGADFKNFIETATNRAAGNLPLSRAQSCPLEYDTIKRAFESLFLPHVDPTLLEKVQAVKWVSFGG